MIQILIEFTKEINMSNFINFLVIGEVCIDVFNYGEVNRLSPEAPVPILTNIKQVHSLGMARNVYENLRTLITKRANSVENPYSTTSIIESVNRSKKIRYVDEKTNHYFLRVDEDVDYEWIDFSNNKVKESIEEADYILISDYNKGFLHYDDILKICGLKKHGAMVFLDTKKSIDGDILESIDFLKCNYSEYKNNISKYLFDEYVKKIIITRGSNGAEYDGVLYPTNPISTMDVSGAGDTFFAALVYKYAHCKNITESIKFANEMANIVVNKKGVSTI